MQSQPNYINYTPELFILPKKCKTRCEPEELSVNVPTGVQIPMMKCTSLKGRSCGRELPLDKFYKNRKVCVYCLAEDRKEKKEKNQPEEINTINYIQPQPQQVPDNTIKTLIDQMTNMKIDHNKEVEELEADLEDVRSERDELQHKIDELQTQLELLKKQNSISQSTPVNNQLLPRQDKSERSERSNFKSIAETPQRTQISNYGFSTLNK